MDVLVPYRRSGSFDRELRYMLRSLSNLECVDKVYMVGEKPTWVQNVEFIEMVQGSQKGVNTRNALILGCLSGISDDFILMADDIYITKPMKEIKLYHGGSLDVFLKKFSARYPVSYYTKKIEKTAKKLPDNPKHYELHVPMVINKHTALSFLADPTFHGMMFRTLYGNIVHEGRGEEIKDVKYYDRTAGPWFKDIEVGFLSSDDKRFKGEVEDYLSRMFPRMCKFEKYR